MIYYIYLKENKQYRKYEVSKVKNDNNIIFFYDKNFPLKPIKPIHLYMFFINYNLITKHIVESSK